MHEHKKDCLWWLYREAYGEEKAHELHTAKCQCFKLSRKDAYNDHAADCSEYFNFYNSLRKVNPKLFEKNCIKDNFLQMLPIGYTDKRQIMCCCSSDLSHNER